MGMGAPCHPDLLPPHQGQAVGLALKGDKGLAPVIPCRGCYVVTITVGSNDNSRQRSLV